MTFFRRHVVLTAALVLLALSAGAQEASLSAPVRTIVIRAKKFEFQPAEITLTKGQPVKLELTSKDVEHTLVIPALGVDAVMKKHHITDVTITPKQDGDFQGKCGKFCGFGHSRMRFVVHVVK